MYRYSFLFLVLVGTMMVTMADASKPRPLKQKRTVRGERRPSRQLHPTKSMWSSSDDGGRTSENGFTAGANPKHGEPGHIHVPKTPAPSSYIVATSTSTITATSPTISNSVTYSSSSTSALTTFDNKCDAAEAGAEYRTDSFVPVYYQYEVVTSPTRNILQLADVVDKAIQHFLAVWLTDCDTSPADANGGLRRDLQMTRAPIMGAGVGEYDTVVLSGMNSQCTSLVALEALGQVCYRVIGSSLIYLDESMQATPQDIRALATETLMVGMNYGTTNFAELDPYIYQLEFIQGYNEAPNAILEENSQLNQRPWATTNTEVNNPSDPAVDQQTNALPSTSSSGRSGGAKFGIAFATLLCIVIAAFVVAFLYKHRERLFDAAGSRRVKMQNKHFSLDDAATQTSSTWSDPKIYPKKTRVVQDGETNTSFRSFAASRSPDAASVATRPLSPDPETPRQPNTPNEQSFSRVVDESNILSPGSRIMEESVVVSPRSDWSCARSSISEMTDHHFPSAVAETPTDRIRIKLSKETIRGSSRKKLHTPSQLVSPDRSYQVEDTVNL